MRNPFSKSKSSLLKRASSSSSSEVSPPSSQNTSMSPDAFEKISVISETPLYKSSTEASSVPSYPKLPSHKTNPSVSPRSSVPPSVIQQTSSRCPRCPLCAEPYSLLITRSSNRNGNAGRPYYKCQPCNKFGCFADTRGDGEENPICECGLSSKRQLSSREKGRRMFYTCRVGECDFFQFYVRENGKTWEVDDDVANALADMKLV